MYADLQQGEHQIVGIIVVPVDLDDEGVPTTAPGADMTPQHVCQICWLPLSDIAQPCEGPKVPNDISSLEDLA